jgi:hypothetical protein
MISIHVLAAQMMASLILIGETDGLQHGPRGRTLGVVRERLPTLLCDQAAWVVVAVSVLKTPAPLSKT